MHVPSTKKMVLSLAHVPPSLNMGQKYQLPFTIVIIIYLYGCRRCCCSWCFVCVCECMYMYVPPYMAEGKRTSW